MRLRTVKEKIMYIRSALFMTALCSALLTGCGFHLRGTGETGTLPARIQTMAIAGSPAYSEFGKEFRKTLKVNGATIVESNKDAPAVLRIFNIDKHRRVVSVSAATGKAQEYELYYSVVFNVTDSSGNEIVKKQRVKRIRDFTFDKNHIIAMEYETETLYKEMMHDVINQVVYRLKEQGRG
jgi:LPS-assembly lipoprotein